MIYPAPAGTAARPVPTPDDLARRWTSSTSVADLAGRAGDGYRPSLRSRTGFGRGRPNRRARYELTVLADAYDRHQADRGDPRRAYRC